MDAEKKLLQSLDAKIAKHTVTVNNHVIHYVTAGVGDPILFIHGATIGWGQWYKNISGLSKFFHIIALDLPGSGKSSKIDFKTTNLEKDFVQTVEKLIKKLKLRKISVIGHSVGGWVAFKLALRNKTIRHLVLINPVGLSRRMPNLYRPLSFYPLAKMISKTIMKPKRSNVKKFLESAFFNKEKLEDYFVDYVYENMRNHNSTHPLLLINKIAGFLKIKKDFSVIEQIENIRIPTLIIVGDKDPLTPVKDIEKNAKKIPYSTLKVIINTGHVPFVEKNEEFEKLLVKFLKTPHTTGSN